MNGSVYGYENKYVDMASMLKVNHGCTVIVASNPNGYEDDFSAEMELIKNYADEHEWENHEVYYMGNSNGACLAMMNAWKHSEIKKVIAVNGPLMIDADKVIEGIKNFAGEKMNLVYGSKDPSFSLIRLYSDLESDKIEIIKVDGADHNFKGFENLFMSIPGHLFFGAKMDCRIKEV